MNRASLAVALAGSLLLPGARALAAPEAPAHAPEVWAVIVAVESYDDPDLPGCPGANRDATALARWFTATAHWGSPHILLMTESGEAKHGRPEELLHSLRPTRENLDWALKQWLGRRLQPGDIGVVYFAGGSAVLDDREVLLPIDAEADDLAHTGWTPEEAVDELAPRKQSSLCLWLDAASPLTELADGRPSTDQAPAVNLLHELTRWPGVSAWLAHSRPIAATAGPGPFTAALARGLGDRPNNLLACLEQLQQDPTLKDAGFRVRGGVSPLLALWPDELLPDHKFKPTLLLQQGHADEVRSVVVTADGEQMITGSLDSTIKIWRVRNGARVLQRLIAYHTNGVTALALSPNGRYIASGDGMGQVRVWDLAEGRERPQEGVSPHHRGITEIGFLPEQAQTHFVVLDLEGRTTLWDATGPVLQKKEFRAVESVRMAVAAQQGPVAAVLADLGGELLLYGADRKPRKSLEGTGGRPTALHLAPDGRWLAAGDESGRVRVWNAVSGAMLLEHKYNDRIGTLRFGPGGGLAVAAGDRMYLAPLDARPSGPGLVLEGVVDRIDSAVFSPDGNWLAARTNNGNRHLWSLRDRARPQPRALPIDGRSSGTTCLAFDRDVQWISAGEGDGGIRRWDLASGRERPRIPPHRGKVAALAVSGDGRFLLQITQDAQALIWDLKEGRGARTLPGR